MALWDKLPPLNEQAHKFQPVDNLKGTLSKKALEAFAPRHKHVPDPRMKQAIVIMDKMITKVMLVSAFPTIVNELQHYKLLLGKDLTEAFMEYDKLSREYDKCEMAKSSRNPALWSAETLKSICQERRLRDALFEHCRKLIHALLNNYEATFAVLRHYHEWRVEHPAAVRHMASLLVQRRYLLRYDFVTTREQAIERENYREGREQRINRISARVTDLLDNLQRINKDNAQVLQGLQEEIEQTEVQLMELEVESNSCVRDLYRKFARKFNEERQQFQSKMQVLGEELRKAKEEFTEHREKAIKGRVGLRRQLNKSGEVVVMCINNMDDKLFDLQFRQGVTMKRIEELNKEHEALLTEFQPIKDEYDGVMELRRKEDEEREREAREKAEMIEAATFIQSLYRSWKARKELKKAGKRMI